MARSKPDPSLRISAGAKFITIRRMGNSNPVLRMAARTLSLASLTAAVGKPTISKQGKPRAISTSTVTTLAVSPYNTIPFVFAYIQSRPL